MTQPVFQVLDLVPILKGGLVARGRLQMPSGMIVSSNVIRSKKDPEILFVLPVGERLQGGGYAPVVDFATPAVRDAWQAAALAALRPRLAELASPPATEGGRYDGQF